MHPMLLRISHLTGAFTIVCTPSAAVAESGLLATTQSADVRRLTIDEAVQIAVENNLGVQTARLDPRIEDLSVARARAAWDPTFSSVVQTVSD